MPALCIAQDFDLAGLFTLATSAGAIDQATPEERIYQNRLRRLSELRPDVVYLQTTDR